MDSADLAAVAAVRGWCLNGGLRVLREDVRVSVRGFARAVSAEAGRRVDSSTVSKWERGARLPREEYALAVFRAAQALAVGSE